MLGLDGSVFGVYSSRTYNLKDIIHIIIGHGHPLVVAADVHPVPAFVDKVCRLFEATLYEPTHSLTIDEKREITSAFSERYLVDVYFRNSHEKDAFAAAAKALESYGDKFRWIDKKLNERGLSDLSEKVKSMVISGKNLSDSINEAMKPAEAGPRPRVPKPQLQVPKPRTATPESGLASTRRIESSMIRNMRREILELRTKLGERELKIGSLGNELERMRSEEFWNVLKDREMKSRNQIITELGKSLSRVAADRARLREKLDSLSGSRAWRVLERLEFFPALGDLAKETVAGVGNLAQKEAFRFVLVKDPSGTGSSVATALAEMGIEAVLVQGEMPPQARQSIQSRGIPVIPCGKLNIVVLDDTALGERAMLDRVLSRERKRLAREALERATSGLEELVDHYRREVSSEKPQP